MFESRDSYLARGGYHSIKTPKILLFQENPNDTVFENVMSSSKE